MGMYEDDRIRHKNKLMNEALELLAFYRDQRMTDNDISAIVESSDLSYDLESTLLALLRKQQEPNHNID